MSIIGRFFNWDKGDKQSPGGTNLAPVTDQYGNQWQWQRMPGSRLILKGTDGQVGKDDVGSTVVREPSMVFVPNSQGLPNYMYARDLVIDEDTGRVINGSFPY